MATDWRRRVVIGGTNRVGGGKAGLRALHVVERFTPIDANTIGCEVPIEDPKVYTRPGAQDKAGSEIASPRLDRRVA